MDASQNNDLGHGSSNSQPATASGERGQTEASRIPNRATSNTAAESITAPVSSSSSRRSDAQQTLEAYLQDGAQSYRPPTAAWQDSTAGFTERIATNYSLPQPAHSLHYAEVDHQYPYPTSVSLSKSSMAPSQSLQVHNRAPSIVASASRYSSCGPPSLVYDDHTSYAESSVDTEYGKIVQGVRLLGFDDALPQPQVNTAPVYECTFNFLGCRFITLDEADWRLHNLSHFHGNVPPCSVACPLCDFGFDAGAGDGHTAWEARMTHLAAHLRMGETLATSRPDFKLFRHLWQKRIIDDAEYKELNGRGTLSAQRTDLELPSTVEGPRYDERRRRVPRYPRPNRVTGRGGGMGSLSKREAEAQKVTPLRTRDSVSQNDIGQERIDATVDSDPTRFFSLGTEFVQFMTRELQDVKDLLEVVVLTGSEDQACAAPCADYAEKIWPELGKPVLLSLVEGLEFLKEFQITRVVQTLETLKDVRLGRTLIISASSVISSSPTDPLRIDFEAQGKSKEVSEFSEILRWLSTVFRKPVPDKLLCSQAWGVFGSSRQFMFTPNPLKAPSGTGGRGRCWHNMFKGYVLAEGFPIPHRGSQSGVELPFDLMTLLGLALYPINFGPGIILKGDNTALIPSTHYSDDDCVQWHYLEGDGSGGPLTWDRIKEHCGNIYPSKDFKLLQRKRTFVGYFPSATVQLGTRGSGFDKVDFSGAEFDDKTAFVLGNELVGQVGTSVMNFFTAQVSGKLMVHRTAHQRLRGIHDSILDKVRNSKDLPILLFDVKTKQGWLVPELSALLHMALAWASYQHQSDEVLSNMPFAEARPDGGEAAYDAIIQSAKLLLPEHIRVGDHDDNQISALQALAPFFSRIGQIKDQQLQRHACGLKESKDLVGYEFKEIASFEEHLHLRRSKVDVDRSGGWLRLVSCKPEMAVILCSHLEAPIRPSPNQHSCPLWQKIPTDQYYLTASVSCLKQLAKRCGGEENFRLYNNIYCIPSKKDPGPGVCGTRKWPCCNPLLELSKHPSKKTLQFDDEGALIIGKAVPRPEENSSLRVFLRSRLAEKDSKSQNGNSSILQLNHQTLNGPLNIPQPQQPVHSRIP